MSAPKRAFTFAEILAGAGLGLLVTVLALQLFSTFFRVSSELARFNQLQERAAVALSRIAADARRSALAGTSIETDKLAFCGLSEVDSRGRQLWDQAASCYFRRGSKFFRERMELPEWPKLRPMRLSPEQFRQLEVSGQSVTLCSDVDAFEASLYGLDRNSSPLTVSLRSTQKLAGRVRHFEVAREICLRNSP